MWPGRGVWPRLSGAECLVSPDKHPQRRAPRWKWTQALTCVDEQWQKGVGGGGEEETWGQGWSLPRAVYSIKLNLPLNFEFAHTGCFSSLCSQSFH